MPTTINQLHIFLPVLAIVALTFVAFVKMAAARGAAAKEKAGEPDYYKAFIGTPEPEYAIVAVRHYGNLFELPVLFYAGCLTAFVIGAVSFWTLLWAWAYVAARVVQSAVHLTYNKPVHRGGAFVIGIACVIALWVTVALGIFARL